jgi:hypothetical protein
VRLKAISEKELAALLRAAFALKTAKPKPRRRKRAD